MRSDSTTLFPRLGQAVGILSTTLIVVSSLWLVWSGNIDVRYSADHENTIPFWHTWVPVIACMILIRLIPIRLEYYNPLRDFNRQRITTQAAMLFLGGALFTVSLLLVSTDSIEFQAYYLLLKLIFLLFLPLIIFYFYQEGKSNRLRPSESFIRWSWLASSIILITWIYLYFYSVFARPHTSYVELGEPITLIGFTLIGFFLNSVLEEFFYRVWVQTRLELLLGTWPAILLTSVLWASWHIAIQGTGQWDIDAATVIANHGVTGLFLGYLWAKYRNVWVLIIIHGLMNAPPQYLLEIFFH